MAADLTNYASISELALTWAFTWGSLMSIFISGNTHVHVAHEIPGPKERCELLCVLRRVVDTAQERVFKRHTPPCGLQSVGCER